MLSYFYTTGMLVKRPFLLGDDFGLLGFKETEWLTLRTGACIWTEAKISAVE